MAGKHPCRRDEIHLSRNGPQEGPYPFDEVRALAAPGSLRASDHAWYHGCTDWIRAGLIPGYSRRGSRSQPPSGPGEMEVRRIGDHVRLSGPQSGSWDPRVIDDLRGIARLVVIAAVNLLLGGAIGVVFAGVDFVIRDKILSNARLLGGGDEGRDPAGLPG